MIEIDNLVIDEKTGEIISHFPRGPKIGHGGLYAAYPIPAVDVLVQAGEIAAKDVLLCLIDYLGETNEVWPSQKSIMKFTKRGKATVLKAIAVLKEYGFIYVYKKPNGIRAENHYFILDACYHHSKMNEKARGYAAITGSCLVCGSALRQGDYKNFNGRTAHWGCSGNIQKKKRANYDSSFVKELVHMATQ